MTTQTAVMPSPAELAPLDETVTVETRFGQLEFSRSNTFHMPHGLLGFADKRDFGIANLPAERYGHFMLLQSLEDTALSFLVLPLEIVPDLIAPEDLQEALTAAGIAHENAIVMLIATARKDDDGTVALSVNLRAPVVIDVERHCARQHVLNNTAYPIRHVLNGGE